MIANRTLPVLVLLSLMAVLGGCASGVQRQQGSSAPLQLGTTERIGDVSVTLTSEAQAKQADNAQFSGNALAERIRNQLSTRGLMAAEGGRTLGVTVTDFRVRSTFSAVMFGFMAGSDNLTAEAQVSGPAGASPKVTLTASYALGGLVGGQSDNRMNWLYDEFARLLVAELQGAGK